MQFGTVVAETSADRAEGCAAALTATLTTKAVAATRVVNIVSLGCRSGVHTSAYDTLMGIIALVLPIGPEQVAVLQRELKIDILN